MDAARDTAAADPGMLPLSVGVGLKPPHFDAAASALSSGAALGLWFEVHPENYMGIGGPRLRGLERIASSAPLSLHGVGASLGGPELPDRDHLARLRTLVERMQPASVSEHAVWSRANGRYFADLLPLPRTHVMLDRLCAGVDAMQNAISRPILLENPSNYLDFTSEMDEPDFLVEAARRTGCGLLLDVNNVFVSAHNTGIDSLAYVRAIPPSLVGEIHVAGHTPDAGGTNLLIDSHDSPVVEPVWALLQKTLEHTGPRPVLLERDDNLPEFETLMKERGRALGCYPVSTADARSGVSV